MMSKNMMKNTYKLFLPSKILLSGKELLHKHSNKKSFSAKKDSNVEIRRKVLKFGVLPLCFLKQAKEQLQAIAKNQEGKKKEKNRVELLITLKIKNMKTRSFPKNSHPKNS